jgi:hypothetical protein
LTESHVFRDNAILMFIILADSWAYILEQASIAVENKGQLEQRRNFKCNWHPTPITVLKQHRDFDPSYITVHYIHYFPVTTFATHTVYLVNILLSTACSLNKNTRTCHEQSACQWQPFCANDGILLPFCTFRCRRSFVPI